MVCLNFVTIHIETLRNLLSAVNWCKGQGVVSCPSVVSERPAGPLECENTHEVDNDIGFNLKALLSKIRIWILIAAAIKKNL